MYNVTTVQATEVWGEAERRRVVRLCAAITGDRDAAEDLAQETLLEAWRNRHKVRTADGADAWLAAIARNVCLRWARRQGRQSELVPIEHDVPLAADVDLEVDLERTELAELLDRALALLPPDTREVLVQRYVHESPHAAIGARLGLSEDAVSMRLTRGKVVLKRVLASELRDEAAAYGLADDDAWRETRIWCADCGARKLHARRTPGAIAFRCPGCTGVGPSAQYRLENPFFDRLLRDVSRPSAILGRAAEWSREYFAAGAGSAAECTRCGRPVRLERSFHKRDGREGDGLYATCGACGEQVSSSIVGLALSQPETRRFTRDHRSKALPHRNVNFDDVPAVVVRHEHVRGGRGVEVVFARDSLRVLDVSTD